MRIAVVGDTLLDIDLTGHADRLCPDAPAPVVDVRERIERPGGAGLVATMLADDGHDVELVTALAGDDAAARLRALLAPVRVTAGALGGPTPVKMRVTADGQRIARVDEGCGTRPLPLVDEAMVAALDAVDAVVVADYGRGVADSPALRAALEAAASRVPLVWDPHPRGPRPVAGAAAVTPNLPELLSLSGRDVHELGAVASAAGRLLQRWGAQSVIVTLAERGALVCSPDGDTHVAVPSAGLRIEDPCGAGDRFASALAVALARGESLEAAAETSVATAVAFLASGGVRSLAPDAGAAADAGASPAAAAAPREMVSRPASGNGGRLGGEDPRASAAVDLARRVRAAGGRVVAAGGCFDLLHTGHLRLLEAARAMGDCLIVCLNSDDSVRRLKGPDRPVMGQADRAELLEGLACVDAVEVFGEDTPEAAIARLRPHVWVKGGDYRADDLPETALLRSWGGETVTVPLEPGRSTTSLATAIAGLG
ncbi:PfkB family carbohydrate kinase [Sinomonas halotolerans]|uniref:PfkB family carbohydrate kinase n=1 Tax=Sinomonas halotolerans TaxID=1644133 RepID=A0ABU9X0B7_9MICC